MNAERPLECSSCTKKPTVFYTQVIGDSISRIAMCASCPSLHHYNLIDECSPSMKGRCVDPAEVCCGKCGMTLEEVRLEYALGCPGCYDVFGEIMLADLIETLALGNKEGEKHVSTLFHVGRIPNETNMVRPFLSLIALNEALNDTLIREDYEQAAWIRDQIIEVKKKQKDRFCLSFEKKAKTAMIDTKNEIDDNV